MGKLGTTILAVDDVGANLITIKHILAGYYELCVAKSAEAGLEVLNRTKVDLVLLDIEMPEIDGFDFFAKMSQNPAQKFIPVIFVTANATKNIIERAIKVGAKDYIVKPVNPDILLQKIKSSLHPNQSLLNSIAELQDACTSGKTDLANSLFGELLRESAKVDKTTEISAMIETIGKTVRRMDFVDAAEELKKLQTLVREKLA
jgi:CheY-like chemotaxis protein